MSNAALISKVSDLLSIDIAKATHLVAEAQRLYVEKMRERFSKLRVSERLKRTNPFLVGIRGLKTVAEWARFQVDSALFASEEEATGHLLEAIAKACHPGATVPRITADLDYEVITDQTVTGYQIKMSWDCMPHSSRKNLSNTVRILEKQYEEEGKKFVGVFAPCYGRAKTSQPPKQAYLAMRSKEFWEQVGAGISNYDAKVGEACALMCSEFRQHVTTKLIPDLVQRLTESARDKIGTPTGDIDYEKLFRRINR